MRASQTMRITYVFLLGFGPGSFSWGMAPQDVPAQTDVATAHASVESSIFSEPALHNSADRQFECSVSQNELQTQALFLARLMRNNKEQENVRLIDFSDAIYAKRALQYKFYTRDVQDLLSDDGPAAAIILSILVPLYQCEYVQEKKENELFNEYLLRSSRERFGELKGLVTDARLFEKLDTLYVPLCEAIIADQMATENERSGEC